jgi:ABC-type oligopeptide transport system ATPase subunit
MLLEARHVCKSFATAAGEPMLALNDVSLAVSQGEAVGLVGESGSGKSTLIQCLMRLTRPDSGLIEYDGIDVLSARGADMKRFRREVQIVFQDPYLSLNQRMTVEQLIGEGLIVHHLERSRVGRRARVAEMLELVGLSTTDMRRYPRSFSGGQRQRIAIGRALAIGPRVLVCDEPVASLDVSVQAQIINLLKDMQRQLGLTILFVAHDLAVVRHLCTQIAVLHRGVMVEAGSTAEVFGSPQATHTKELLDAVPIPDPSIGQNRHSDRMTAKMRNGA